jgi:hypothetical protein
MKELQVLAATSTPILQRFARFFTDILHESCRAIIVNTAVGTKSLFPSNHANRTPPSLNLVAGLFPDPVISPLAVTPSLPLMAPADLALPAPMLEPRR